ncbi:cysteine ase [Pyrrhoderma noxium]|uniref:ubiquitinyl hydrolase 1 n=1 Tax=Pyrrhoderma noxium TaxID=2282107 RepID=A0A286UST7_9AGAM|nr:cysteine ase [Pyrrhoderma noxium]
MTIPTLNELVHFKLFGTNATSVDLICILAAASIFWFLHAKKAQKPHVSSRQNNDLFSERSEDHDPLENCKFENVRVTKLLIHPIKSCRGTSVLEANYNEEGLEFDRKLAIIDANTHRVITARERSKMVLIHPRINPDESDFDGGRIDITFPEDSGCKDFAIPLNPCKETLETWTRLENIELWGQNDLDGYICQSIRQETRDVPSRTLSQFLGCEVLLVLKGPRPRSCSPTTDFPSLSANTFYQDGYPLLVASEESLIAVQERLRGEVGKQGVAARWSSDDLVMERFRPNIVIGGAGVPWAEDTWERIQVGANTSDISLVSKCTRCLLPNVDPDTGVRDAAVPYKVLMKFRSGKDPARLSKPCFGCNGVPSGNGVIRCPPYPPVACLCHRPPTACGRRSRCVMALAKWMGFGSSQSPASSQNIEAQTSNHAKTTTISKLECKQFGFENFGNTCYVNSVLQALYFCYPFRKLVEHVADKSNPYVLSTHSVPSSSPTPSNPRAKNARKPSSAEMNNGVGVNDASSSGGPPIPPAPPTMFSALRALFMHISGNTLDKGVIAPKAFVEKLKKENELFRSQMHQDAHELLIFLLNKIAEDLEDEARNSRSGSSGEDLSSSVTSSGPSTRGTMCSSAHSTLVHDIFEGVLTSETRCLTCETVSSRDEAFLDLSIDIERNSSVTACLRQFSASEMLCQRNKFFCDSCCGLQEAEKRMKIKRLPNVLALHLKRFKYQDDVGKYIKLGYRVAFPLELRLFNTVDDAQDPDRLYELFAIVVHIGNGPHHGHYIAIIKSNGLWLVFDDDTVDVIKESDISKYFGDTNNGCAYVLFYQAVDLDLQALGLKEDEAPVSESVSESTDTQAPLLPPGLTHEGDSDTSEIAPATPGSPAMIPVPTIVPGSPSPLTVIIPLQKYRQQYQLMSRHQLKQSAQDACSPPIPPIPLSAISSPQVSNENSQASTSTTSPAPTVNTSLVRSPKEKSSGWFSRKRSLRPEKEKQSDHLKQPFITHDRKEGHDTTSSNGTFTGTTSSTSSRVPHVPNGSPFLNASASTSETPSLHLLTSEPEQMPTTSENHTPAPVQNGYPSQSVPPSSANHASHPLHHIHLPGHKKSQPDLPSPIRSSMKTPKRPSTANAVLSSSSRGTFRSHTDDTNIPVPPLPSNMQGVSAPVPRHRSAMNDPSISREERDRRRFSSHVTSTPPSSMPTKRSSRKLSFSSVLPSFVRKDRDKEKHHKNGDISNGPLSPTPKVVSQPMFPSYSVSGRM